MYDSVPTAINTDFILPEALDFCFPICYTEQVNREDGSVVDHEPVTLKSEDERLLHRQLVCWCLIQRFWYYILNDPQVEDTTYDQIENYLRETEASYLRNKFSPAISPTKQPGSSRIEDYPKSVIGWFREAELPNQE